MPPRPGQGEREPEQGISAHLHVVDAFGLCIHHEEAVIKVLFGPPPDSLLGVPKGLSEAGEVRVEVGGRGDDFQEPRMDLRREPGDRKAQ